MEIIKTVPENISKIEAIANKESLVCAGKLLMLKKIMRIKLKCGVMENKQEVFFILMIVLRVL